MVAEADESDGSLLNLKPEIAIVTNIETDHLDYYRDFEHVLDVFTRFAGQVDEDGCIVTSLDDYGCCRFIDCVDRRFITYSVRDSESDVYAAEINLQPWHSEYMCVFRDEVLGKVRLSVPGIHNVSNSLAALGVGLHLGLDFRNLADSLETFHGAARRFQIKGRAAGITVIDDYAHHPTEVRATLNSARKVAQQNGGRVIALFQPHRYSRTLHLSRQFGKAFGNADIVVITDVYPAGEQPIDGVSGEIIYKNINLSDGLQPFYCANCDEIVDMLTPLVKENDIVLTIGAGDIWKVGERLVTRLCIKESSEALQIQ